MLVLLLVSDRFRKSCSRLLLWCAAPLWCCRGVRPVICQNLCSCCTTAATPAGNREASCHWVVQAAALQCGSHSRSQLRERCIWNRQGAVCADHIPNHSTHCHHNQAPTHSCAARPTCRTQGPQPAEVLQLWAAAGGSMAGCCCCSSFCCCCAGVCWGSCWIVSLQRV